LTGVDSPFPNNSRAELQRFIQRLLRLGHQSEAACRDANCIVGFHPGFLHFTILRSRHPVEEGERGLTVIQAFQNSRRLVILKGAGVVYFHGVYWPGILPLKLFFQRRVQFRAGRFVIPVAVYIRPMVLRSSISTSGSPASSLRCAKETSHKRRAITPRSETVSRRRLQ
jgi:hypothetical protein